MDSITIVPQLPPVTPPGGSFAPLDPASARQIYGKVKDSGIGGPKPSAARLAIYMVAGISGWGSAAKVGNVTESGATVTTAFSGRGKVSRGTPITPEKAWGWVEATHQALIALKAGEKVVISAAAGAAAGTEAAMASGVSNEIENFKLFPDPQEFRFLAWHALKDAAKWNRDATPATIARIDALYSGDIMPFNAPSGSGNSGGMYRPGTPEYEEQARQRENEAPPGESEESAGPGGIIAVIAVVVVGGLALAAAMMRRGK